MSAEKKLTVANVIKFMRETDTNKADIRFIAQSFRTSEESIKKIFRQIDAADPGMVLAYVDENAGKNLKVYVIARALRLSESVVRSILNDYVAQGKIDYEQHPSNVYMSKRIAPKEPEAVIGLSKFEVQSKLPRRELKLPQVMFERIRRGVGFVSMSSKVRVATDFAGV